MEFFNRKEEVMDIQLTQHGKYLLSLGKFKPDYYAFYDHDIIYDLQYASGSEKQSKTEERMREIPRLKTQYVYSGIETEITKTNKAVRFGQLYGDTDLETEGIQFGVVEMSQYGETGMTESVEATYPPTEAQPHQEKNYSLALPLGHSEMGNQNAPAWDIKFLHSFANSYENHLSGTNFSLLPVPQALVDVEYKTYRTFLDEDGNPSPDFLASENKGLGPRFYGDAGDLHLTEYGNNTTIQVKKDYILLDILEENVPFEKENFDIEVYELEYDASGDVVVNEKQLFFLEDPSSTATENNVEWWFDIFVDNEIDPDIYCSAKGVERKNIFADQFELFKCADREKEIGIQNIYALELTEEDFEEPC